MTRAVTMFAMLLTVLAFANMGSAGGMERVQRQMVQAGGAFVLLQSQHDRCQMKAPCAPTCVLCAAGAIITTAHAALSPASGADLHRRLDGRRVGAGLYRPPRA